MHKLPAIVVPFCKGINGRASTFGKACRKGALLLGFRVFSVTRRIEQVLFRGEKISYFCEVTTCFGISMAIS